MDDSQQIFQVVLDVPIKGITVPFPLDLCKTRTVRSEATIAKYPIEGGVTISDHMYIEPKTLELQGSFSLNGLASQLTDCYTIDYIKNATVDKFNWEDYAATIEGNALVTAMSEGGRLARIQSFFEWIQANGLLCTVYLQYTGENYGITQFKTRGSMALKGISWAERVNSMGFTFSFFQIIVIKIDGFEPIEGSLLPSLSELQMGSLGQLLIETEGASSIVIESLVNLGYISIEDVKVYCAATNNSALQNKVLKQYIESVGSLSDASKTVSYGLAKTMGVDSWIRAGIYYLINSVKNNLFFKNAVSNYAKAAEQGKIYFNLIKDYYKYIDSNGNITLENIQNAEVNSADVQRLNQLLNYVKYSMTRIQDTSTLYQITTKDDNIPPQKFMLEVGGQYIYIEISKDNGGFNLKVYESSAEGATPKYSGWPQCCNLSQLTRTNAIYTTSDLQYEVYLICPFATTNDSAYNNLKNYYILMVKGRIESLMNDLTTAIQNAVKNYITDQV